MYIACDIGGTLMRIAGSKDLENFDEPIIHDTPADYETGFKTLVESIKKVANQEKIEAIVLGLPGVISKDREKVLRSPHLPNWQNQNIVQALKDEFCPMVFLENDACLVGLGEAHFGAGQGYEIMAYLTISTGIGGAKIAKGFLDERRLGFEPGFQILDVEKSLNFEDLASGTSVFQRSGMHPREFAKTEGWNEIEKYVAAGIHNTILHWSPDVVVLGGGMSKDFRLDNLKQMIRKYMLIFDELPEIKLGTLGKVGGIHGGFVFLKQSLSKL